MASTIDPITEPLLDLQRTSRPLGTPRARRRYFIILGTLIALSLLFAYGLLAWNNPMPFGTDGFWRIAERRYNSVIAMVIVAFCQGIATVAFQTVELAKREGIEIAKAQGKYTGRKPIPTDWTRRAALARRSRTAYTRCRPM